jgi:hypothetical protein
VCKEMNLSLESEVAIFGSLVTSNIEARDQIRY